LFYLFQNLIYENITESVKIQLKGAKLIYEEKAAAAEAALSQISDRPEIKQGFDVRDEKRLQAMLFELGKKNPYLEIMAAVDENQKVITRRNNNKGDFLNIGEILPVSLVSGKAVISTEIVSKDLLLREDEGLAKRIIKDTGMAQFIVSPVRYNDRIVGAIVAGVLITGNPWFGNTVYNRFTVETAVFGGEPPESAFLHSSSSLPRSAWVSGQPIPQKVGAAMSLGLPYYGTLSIDGAEHLAAYEPIKDSRNRIIGSIGVSRPAAAIHSIVLQTVGKGVFVSAVIGLIISVIITLFIYADITRPLSLLIHAMDEVGKGAMDINVELKTGDQFEKIGRGFNSMVQGIRKREERLKKHNEIAKLLMSTLDLNELLSKILRIAVEITDSQMGIVYLCEEGGELLVPHAQYGTKADIRTLKKGEGFPGSAAIDNKTYILSSNQDAIAEVLEFGFTQVEPNEVAYIPLSYQDRILGVLALGGMNRYTEEKQHLFEYMANQISVALDNAIIHQKIQELSVTDSLTGLYNRRHLNGRLEEEWSRALRRNRPISILLADVDNFKSVNDGYGHEKGDEVLKGIANIMKNNVRKEDLVARYGGEEFVIILVDTVKEDAQKIADKMLDIARVNIYPWMGKAATFSVGIASYPDIKANKFEELIQAADQAMYKAKVAGKNRVIVSGEPSGKA
ncbi:MAG: diguanylate cyclase, partial [Deltaproteobacteria bacterium]|nr:diguanylate cyclase [Deltaproteobacteria bacterium]